MSVEDDNFLREGWGCVNLTIFSQFESFYILVVGNFGFAVSVCRLRERGHMPKSVYVRVVHDLALLRYVLRCTIEQQL